MNTTMSLHDRLSRVNRGYASDPNYTAGLAARLADATLAEYMQGFPGELEMTLDILGESGIGPQSSLAETAFAFKQFEETRRSEASLPAAFALFKPFSCCGAGQVRERARPDAARQPEKVPLGERLSRFRQGGNSIVASLLSLNCPGFLEGFEMASGGVKLSGINGEIAEAVINGKVKDMRTIARVVHKYDGDPEHRWIIDLFLIEPLATMLDHQHQGGCR